MMSDGSYNISRIPLLAEALTPLYFQWANEMRIGEIAVHAAATPLEELSIADMVVPSLRNAKLEKYLREFARRTHLGTQTIRFVGQDGPVLRRVNDHISVSTNAITETIRGIKARAVGATEIYLQTEEFADSIRVASGAMAVDSDFCFARSAARHALTSGAINKMNAALKIRQMMLVSALIHDPDQAVRLGFSEGTHELRPWLKPIPQSLQKWANVSHRFLEPDQHLFFTSAYRLANNPFALGAFRLFGISAGLFDAGSLCLQTVVSMHDPQADVVDRACNIAATGFSWGSFIAYSSHLFSPPGGLSPICMRLFGLTATLPALILAFKSFYDDVLRKKDRDATLASLGNIAGAVIATAGSIVLTKGGGGILPILTAFGGTALSITSNYFRRG